MGCRGAVMTEAPRDGEKKPSEQSGADTKAPDPKSSTSTTKDATRQDKTKDRPDSGQNEDG